MEPILICWLRRDLRLDDQAALWHALSAGMPVLPVFIFDRHILDKLEDRSDRRVEFIHQALAGIQAKLRHQGSSLEVYYGTPETVFPELIRKYRVHSVYTNHDYEPYARERDRQVAELLQKAGVGFRTFKDQVLLEKDEVLKDDGKPYTVFTPYSRKWRSVLTAKHLVPFDTRNLLHRLYQQDPVPLPSLESMGFRATGLPFPPAGVEDELLRHYARQRDFPEVAGTSRLGVHLRFGTLSIRQLAAHAQSLSDTFLNELIWRDFYHMILWHFPRVGSGQAFKPEYDRIEWRNHEDEFAAWCAGQTGYPIVDAGMRELNATGFMHNRVRMITASFLTKHLLIDWRWGEAYFAQKLLDFDLAANNGGWQWAAGSGCDAAPYFRIFNPRLQTEKFDKNLTYIRKWVPELNSFGYPKPIVEHETARKRCLEVYGKALGKAKL